MDNFTTQLKTKEGTLQFYFNRLVTPEGVRYHVSVTDRQNKTHIFLMQKNRGLWHFANASKVPYWLQLLEGDLHLAIHYHREFSFI
jgi:hypothetical protein